MSDEQQGNASSSAPVIVVADGKTQFCHGEARQGIKEYWMDEGARPFVERLLCRKVARRAVIHPNFRFEWVRMPAYLEVMRRVMEWQTYEQVLIDMIGSPVQGAGSQKPLLGIRELYGFTLSVAFSQPTRLVTYLYDFRERSDRPLDGASGGKQVGFTCDCTGVFAGMSRAGDAWTAYITGHGQTILTLHDRNLGHISLWSLIKPLAVTLDPPELDGLKPLHIVAET